MPLTITLQPNAWRICALAGLFYCYEYLLRIAPNAMVNELMATYDLSAMMVGNLIAFYYYAYAPMQLFVGIILDKYGPRRILTLATFLCALGTLLFCLGGTLTLACAGRFLVGLGSAFAFVGILKLSYSWFPIGHFSIITGLTITFGTLGAVFGGIIVGWFVQSIGWQMTECLFGAIGLILTPIIWISIVDGPVKERTPFNARELWAGILQLLKNSQLWINALIGCLIFLPTSVFSELWGPSYLMKIHQLEIGPATTATSMTFLGWALGAPIASFLSNKIGNRKIPLVIACLVSFILLSVVLYFPDLSAYHLSFLLFLFGLFSSPQVLVFIISLEKFKTALSGTLFSFNNFIIMMMGFIFQPLMGFLLDLSMKEETSNSVHSIMLYSKESFYTVFGLLPLALLLALFLLIFLKETGQGTAVAQTGH